MVEGGMFSRDLLISFHPLPSRTLQPVIVAWRRKAQLERELLGLVPSETLIGWGAVPHALGSQTASVRFTPCTRLMFQATPPHQLQVCNAPPCSCLSRVAFLNIFISTRRGRQTYNSSVKA